MRRKTHKRPHDFTVGKDKFRSHKLGFLESGEISLKYLPTLVELVKSDLFKELDIKDEEGVEDNLASIDITKIINSIPKDFITDLATDILSNTEVAQVKEDNEGNPIEDDSGNFILTGKFSQIDPNDFEGIKECISVVFEVFKHNFPDFFPEGRGTLEESVVPQPKMEPMEIKNKPQRIDL